MPRAVGLGDIPHGLDPGLARLLGAIKERLEQLGGQRGGSAPIGELALLTEMLADRCVTEPKLADKVVSKDKLADGAVSTPKLVDLAVTQAKLADGAVAYSKLTSAAITALLRKNAIINGDFSVWQRGTNFAAVANATYTADRWVYEKSGAMVHTLSQSTDVPTVAQAGRLFNYSLLVDCTTIDAALGAAEFTMVTQRIEGFNFVPLAQRALVLSFWVKATKTGTYCVAFRNSIADRSFVAEYVVNAADTWEFKTVTILASTSAGTWNYTTGIGLMVSFTLAAGADLQAAAGAWHASNEIATANQVNACDNVANNFRICGVQLEASSVATPFEQLTYNLSLELSKRYCQVFRRDSPGSSAPLPNCWGTTYPNNGNFQIVFQPEMRASPTLTSAGTFTLHSPGVIVLAASAPAFGTWDKYGAQFSVTHASGGSAGNPAYYCPDTSTANITANAEL